MKIILFILLISHLTCGIYRLEKYDCSRKITDSYGLVVLDLLEFDDGDSIYITYNTYEGEYYDYIYYEFSDYYPRSQDHLLEEWTYCYSDTYSSHKHNKSDGYGGYYIYYTYDYYYYFEFIKPNNTRYLIMGYDLGSTKAYHLYVDNTRFGRWTTTIIIVCCVVGAVLIAGGIFLIWKFHDSISCDCFLGLFACLSCADCCHKTYSTDITSTSYSNNNTDKLLSPIPSTPSESQEEKSEQIEKPMPPPEVKPIELPNANYTPNDAPEQPYYMQDNQNQNYVSPQDAYGQNVVYPNNNQYVPNPRPGQPQNDYYVNNNQYPPNPPPGEAPNDGGFNSQNYYGGGGFYQ